MNETWRNKMPQKLRIRSLYAKCLLSILHTVHQWFSNFFIVRPPLFKFYHFAPLRILMTQKYIQLYNATSIILAGCLLFLRFHKMYYTFLYFIKCHDIEGPPNPPWAPAPSLRNHCSRLSEFIDMSVNSKNNQNELGKQPQFSLKYLWFLLITWLVMG